MANSSLSSASLDGVAWGSAAPSGEPSRDKSVLRAADLSEVTWVKSDLSGNSGGDGCVEVAPIVVDGVQLGVAQRDSTDPTGPVLYWSNREWAAFTGGVKADQPTLILAP